MAERILLAARSTFFARDDSGSLVSNRLTSNWPHFEGEGSGYTTVLPSRKPIPYGRTLTFWTSLVLTAVHTRRHENQLAKMCLVRRNRRKSVLKKVRRLSQVAQIKCEPVLSA